MAIFDVFACGMVWYEMKIEAVKNMLKERIWEGIL